MIIDPTYIQQVLNIEVSDSVINYLIKHIFNYICKEVGLESSLEKEEGQGELLARMKSEQLVGKVFTNLKNINDSTQYD